MTNLHHESQPMQEPGATGIDHLDAIQPQAIATLIEPRECDPNLA